MQTDLILPPPSLTPWQMVLTADLVVQGVMAILLLASIATWTVLVAKGIEIAMARRRLAAGLRAAEGRTDLPNRAEHADLDPLAGFVAAAEEELSLSADLPAEGVKERVALRLRRLEHGAARRLARGTGLLASIGSCGPFVGLFGTVWGIMNSFVGISRTQTTNLAVVAPGIAEALLATACGLAAAIPAVLIYNLFARAVTGYRAGLGDLAAMVLAQASRQIDRRQRSEAPGPWPRPVPLRKAAE